MEGPGRPDGSGGRRGRRFIRTRLGSGPPFLGGSGGGVVGDRRRRAAEDEKRAAQKKEGDGEVRGPGQGVAAKAGDGAGCEESLQFVDRAVEVFHGGADPLLADKAPDVGREFLRRRKREAAEKDGNDVDARFQRTGDFAAHPVALVDAAVEGSGREEDDHVPAGADGVENLFVEVAGAERLQVEGGAIAVAKKPFVKQAGGAVRAFAPVGEKDVIAGACAAHGRSCVSRRRRRASSASRAGRRSRSSQAR